jgi:cyclophilin family peptidyl-prolyl cis-trans isomerase
MIIYFGPLVFMCANSVSERRRSRPVTKQSKVKKIKKNKSAMLLAIFIVLMLVLGSSYVLVTNLGGNSDTHKVYLDDPEYKAALAGTDYPVAVLETSKGVIAIELYDDQAPETCQNFIKLVNDGFYDGMIFQRVMDGFMIQAGNTMPDGSTKTSPYGQIGAFEGRLTHVDGAISMASTGAGVPGKAQFFIMDGARVGPQYGMDGSYAAFGKTIYGIEVVRDIADEPNDGRYEPSPGGGKPLKDVIIEKIYMAKE